MRTALSLIILLLGTASAGCASRPSRIAFEASPRDSRRSSGRGEAAKSSPGRHGLIDFSLDATTATAYGDVFMMADDAKEPYASYRGTPPASVQHVPDRHEHSGDRRSWNSGDVDGGGVERHGAGRIPLRPLQRAAGHVDDGTRLEHRCALQLDAGHVRHRLVRGAGMGPNGRQHRRL
jgi:hypothetical protein